MPLGTSGTWLARPHRLLRESLEFVPTQRPVVAYDLGAGIGRHTLPLLRELPAGSEVYAVDLIPSALERLEDEVPEGLDTTLHVRAADLDSYEFEKPAGLVIAFSVLEHLPDTAAVGRALERIRSALSPGGVVAVGIVADRVEIDDAGLRRPARIETALTSAAATDLLRDAFDGFRLVSHRTSSAEVREERDGRPYTLASTLVTWLVSAPPCPVAE